MKTSNYLSVSQYAALYPSKKGGKIGVTRHYIYYLIKIGELKAVEIGGKTMIKINS
jgi:hypothetical protein